MHRDLSRLLGIGGGLCLFGGRDTERRRREDRSLGCRVLVGVSPSGGRLWGELYPSSENFYER